jgi:hypothetical protein
MQKRTLTLVLSAIIANAVLANAQLAQDILLKAKQVTGGDAWDTIRTTHNHIGLP